MIYIQGTNNNLRHMVNSKPEPNEGKFSRILNGLGRFVGATGRAAAHLIPGASVICEFFSLCGLGDSSPNFGGMMPNDMLGIQQEMLQEARMYTLISNIMRLRHDAAMSAIRNIK